MTTPHLAQPDKLPVGSFPNGQRTEDKLLLACSRRSLTPAAASKVHGYLEQQLDWDYIVAQAQEHSVLPLLNQHLQPRFSDLLPVAARTTLHEMAGYCQRNNLAFAGELLRILSLFEKSGIDAIPFKGPVLAIIAYGNLALRMFADLDILIQEKDLISAREALVADGYVTEFTFTPEQERSYLKAECALQLRHPGRDFVVELHWLLTERYLSINFPMAELWQRCSVAKIGRTAVKALSPEDLLLYLCVHGSKHHWERLEWLSCVAEVIGANPSIDWVSIDERARKSGTQRILRIALILAHHLLATPLPEELRTEVEGDSVAVRLAHRAATELFARQVRSLEQRAKGGAWYLYLLRTRERWSDKARILTYSAMRQPHPSAQEFVKLPPSLAFLYYFLRPARLMGTALWSGLRAAAGSSDKNATSDMGSTAPTSVQSPQ